MMTNREPKLGEILVRKGWIDAGTLENALKKQASTRKFLGQILLSDKNISEEQLAMALSEQNKIPFIRLTDFSVDWTLVMRFSAALILNRQCFPLRSHSAEITFAITNVLDAWTLSQIETEARGYQIKLVLITQSDMNDLLERFRQYVNIKTRKQFDSKQS